MFELNFWLSKEWTNWTNENFFKLIKAWIEQDKEGIMKIITFNRSLDNIKQDKETQNKVIKLLETLKEFIKIFKDNPAEINWAFGWGLYEVKAINVDINWINRIINEVIQEINN